ncbi:SDR family oxidoreductase [Rhodococcoides yunnanense]|uniref:SDR family oxidoreductase n=1 Tax=Rhodococcoides yunnanense TaxID=278209 RepID=UPI0009338CEB|nr:SDR family oxidoreductase [Rhodococcus yunnanensis]
MSRRAIVAGATGGIGGACARALHAEGYELVLNARREVELQTIADELGATAVAGDCADEAVTARVVDAAGEIDVIVHSVGVLNPQSLTEQSLADFDNVIRVNLRSAYVLVRASLPALRPGGRIILISSIAPKLAMRGTGAYAAAKSGMNTLAAVLSNELERDGINVHVVSPGPVETGMVEDTVKPYASLTSEDVAEVVRWLTTLPPYVQVGEIDVRAAARGPYGRIPVGGSSNNEASA